MKKATSVVPLAFGVVGIGPGLLLACIVDSTSPTGFSRWAEILFWLLAQVDEDAGAQARSLKVLRADN